MIEFVTSGTYGGEIHYKIDGQEVTKEQYQTAWDLEQLIKELV